MVLSGWASPSRRFLPEGQPVSSHDPNGLFVLGGASSNGCASSARRADGRASTKPVFPDRQRVYHLHAGPSQEHSECVDLVRVDQQQVWRQYAAQVGL